MLSKGWIALFSTSYMVFVVCIDTGLNFNSRIAWFIFKICFHKICLFNFQKLKTFLYVWYYIFILCPNKKISTSFNLIELFLFFPQYLKKKSNYEVSSTMTLYSDESLSKMWKFWILSITSLLGCGDGL